jgi:hypothetical protein
MPGITLPTVPTVVKINGSAVSLPRPVKPVRLVAWRKGSLPSFTFMTRGLPLYPAASDPYLWKSVEVLIEGTRRFLGRVVQRHPRRPQKGVGRVVLYQCLGVQCEGDNIPHTDGLAAASDNSTFNAAPDTQSTEWLGARAGRTLGQVFADVLTGQTNAERLDAAGLGAYVSLSPPTLPASTLADLAALSVIPQSAVRFGGEKLFAAVEGALRSWAPHHAFWIDPADGALRFFDFRTCVPDTLTVGTDPVELPDPPSLDLSACFSAVEVRGERIAEMAALRLSSGGIDESLFAHDGLSVADAKTEYRPNDTTSPGFPAGQATASVSLTTGAVSGLTATAQGYGYGSAPSVVILGDGTGATATATLTGDRVSSYTVTNGGSGYTSARAVVGAAAEANGDAGACVCLSTTSVQVTSANPAARFGSNYLDQATGRRGVFYGLSSVTSGVDSITQRRIVANTAMTPGGTATLTLDRALPHIDFDSYVIACEVGGAANVYSLYYVTDPDVRDNLAPMSSFPAAYTFAGGSGATLTSTAMGTVLWAADESGNPPYEERSIGVDVDRVNGTVRFRQSTYTLAGGREPDDVRAMVPVYTGSNRTTWPAETTPLVPVYDGGAFDDFGLERVLTLTVGAWRDPANLTAMTAFAQDVWESVSEPVQEGQVVVRGLYLPALAPGGGLSVDDVHGETLGWEGADLPIVGGAVEWGHDAVPVATVVECSNRRAHYAAEAFLHPDRTGSELSWAQGQATDTAAAAALAFAATPTAGGQAAAQLAAAGSVGSVSAADLPGLKSGDGRQFGKTVKTDPAPDAAE